MQSSHPLRVTLAQLRVERTMAQNREKLLSVLQSAHPGDWVAFPEGLLTGYFPEEDDYLRSMQPEMVDRTIREIGQQVQRLQCYCLFGSATFTNGAWHNSVILQGPVGETYIYHKIELSNLDKRHFTPGDTLSVQSLNGITVGIQACRELLFPESWALLRKRGAQLIFHINNAVKPHDKVWEHVLISRAVENVCFVCSVNNAASPQELTSYLIDPSGKVLLEAGKQVEQILTCEIDLEEANRATIY